MDFSPDQLTKTEIKLVKSKWSRLLANKNAVRQTFYEKIFELAPVTRSFFRESFLEFDSLPDSWELMYSSVDDLQSVIPELLKLGLKHKTYKIKKSYYEVGREALSWTLEKHLDGEYTPEVNEAWTKLFDFMSYYMIEGMKRRK